MKIKIDRFEIEKFKPFTCTLKFESETEVDLLLNDFKYTREALEEGEFEEALPRLAMIEEVLIIEMKKQNSLL